jgi:PPOX class probable F420-dependent enzyme
MSSATVPEKAKDLLERPIIVTLATLSRNNQPQAQPVWFSYDGDHIWINTARGRRKDKNMTERPQVSILSVDPDNPYRYLEVRGVVEEITEEGAVDHINALAKRYRGRDNYYEGQEERRALETRVIYKIKPTRFVAPMT